MKKKEQKRTTDKKIAMIKALGTTFGNVSEAIKLLKESDITVGRTAHYRWLDTDEDYKEAVSNAAEKTLDLVEKALINQIKKGSVQATMFYLKTKGRQRGFNEKLDINLDAKVEPIQIIFNDNE